MQLSKIMVGMVMMILLVSGIFIFLQDGINRYNPTVDSEYNQSFIEIQNLMSQMGNTTLEMEQDLKVDSTGAGSDNDFLGFFFNSAYTASQTAKTAIISMNTFIEIAITESIGDTAYGNLVKSALLITVLIVIVVGLIMHFVIKSDRT